MALSEQEKTVVKMMRAVSAQGREKVVFWVEAVFEMETWRKTNPGRADRWQS